MELNQTEVRVEKLLNAWVTFIVYEKCLYKCVLSKDAFMKEILYKTQTYVTKEEPFQELITAIKNRKQELNEISKYKRHPESQNKFL